MTAAFIAILRRTAGRCNHGLTNDHILCLGSHREIPMCHMLDLAHTQNGPDQILPIRAVIVFTFGT